MRRPSKKALRSRRIMLLLFLFLTCLILWGVFTLGRHVLRYARGASIRSVQTEQTQQPDGSLPSDPSEDDSSVPKNQYDENCFFTRNGLMCYDGPEASSLIGIDVSAHQQQIDWEAVAACGVQYAVIRIGYRGYTEGAIQLDDCFAQNLQGAREAGLQIGVYFFSQALDEQEAREEAAFVLKTLDGQALELPVFFDWEEIDGEARSDVIDRTTLTLLADAFCQKIESGGYAAGIYFNQKFGYEELNLQSLLDYSFWLAEYNPTPTFRYGFQFWQYACDGTIDGITGPVDLNVAFIPK